MAEVQNTSRTKRVPPINQKQKEKLTEFLQNHENLVSGTYHPEFTKQTARNLWENITLSLNAVPGGSSKTWDQWRKTWQDMKKNVKSKTSENKRYAEGTGGGPIKIIKWDDTDEKILNLISPKVIFGDTDVPEPHTTFEFGSHTEESLTIINKENVIIVPPEVNIKQLEFSNDNTNEEREQKLPTKEDHKQQPSQRLAGRTKFNKTKRLETSTKISADLVKIEKEKKDAVCHYYQDKRTYLQWRQAYEKEKLECLKKTADIQQKLLEEIKELKMLLDSTR